MPSALVAGSLAPDLPYHVPLRWIGGDYNLTLTHTASSVLWLDPLIGLLLLLAFHLALERPLLALLPPAAAGGCGPAAHRFPRPGPVTAVRVLLSLVVGAATHLAWDALADVLGSAWVPSAEPGRERAGRGRPAGLGVAPVAEHPAGGGPAGR
ncbi:hypothetical protein A7K94_0205280, partial [Modestobacter sp. VKM Ac-2676]